MSVNGSVAVVRSIDATAANCAVCQGRRLGWNGISVWVAFAIASSGRYGTGMRLKIARIVFAMATAVLLPCWFYTGALISSYVYRPREPQPEIGRIIPYTAKRVTIYITTTEQSVVVWLTRVEIGAGVILLVTVLIGGPSNFIAQLRR
jgi:hypothetical protein